MVDLNSPVALEARDAALSHLRVLFAQPDWLNDADASGLVRIDSARHGSFVSLLQRPFRALDMREGLLIETALGLALQADSRFYVVGKFGVDVSEPDRALVARNAFTDLGAVEPPAPGRRVDTGEIDLVAVDRENGELLLLDVKRGAEVGEADRLKFAETTLAARRALRDVGLRFACTRAINIRWFRAARSPQTDVVLGRTSIDAAMRAEIREIVDHAVGVYRSEFVRRLRTLLAERQDRSGLNEPPAASPTPAPVRRAHFDDAALRQAFQRAARQGGV